MTSHWICRKSNSVPKIAFCRYKTPLVLDPKDKRFGVSSITRFEGDEDDPGSRAKLQLEQQHVWLQQQMMERNQQECARRAADLALEEAEIAEGLRCYLGFFMRFSLLGPSATPAISFYSSEIAGVTTYDKIQVPSSQRYRRTMPT